MMTKNLILVLFILLFISENVQAQQPAAVREKPKVVIGLMIENMRPDYIQRYWDKLGPNGFKKLYNNGAVCTNINLTQHIQSYAGGTATLFTGVHPSMHGIVDKKWYDRLKQKEIECTRDDYYFTVGADTDQGNASPKKLLSNTITDNLKIFSRGEALVFSAAMNRESAIFSAGHVADGAYWYDTESGKIISSSFYLSTFPEWVREFNTQNYGEMYSYRNWVTFMPPKEYTESEEDNYILEKGYFDRWNTFPHTVGRYSRKAENLSPVKTTPYANQIIKDFAIRLMENEPIGQDEVTDFFTITFSSMDYENGNFGPASVEMQDTYLYMDQYIGEVINHAENKYGKDNVLFFLTANTSASYPVEYLQEEFNMPVDHFSPESAIALLTSYLNITYGQENWIEYYSDLQVYLNHELIKKNKINLDEMRDEASNFINQFEGVQVSLPAYQLEQGNSPNGLLSLIYKSYAKNRSGDFLFLLKEGWQPSYKFKKVNYTDQSHIPLVFYGGGISPKIISKKQNAVDFAPTLCHLIGIPMPDKTQGEVISDMID
ncbi:Type I phosphodiesterase / nucleotide pyrophosphatase [Tangfeifania diversioriginum]|uniref:Type I phosphodiesterase / nucleotide pyrophosphatase n=1 Tax=Tangfeifania diversioriginum TaxID=1168035 RepID=A0A1M6H0R9_9BACT|nr:alkaline phosphatase family protein [Tangfeifania diversioriginum]SHJ15781.1 Type I phosphodiesterase / nucleotide pyrophosphatase [Tangfeifania diversioriginum]